MSKTIGDTGFAASMLDSKLGKIVPTSAMFTSFRDAKMECPNKIIRKFAWTGLEGGWRFVGVAIDNLGK